MFIIFDSIVKFICGKYVDVSFLYLEYLEIIYGL